MLPREQIVDAGYADAELVVSSLQDHHITLVGPMRPQAGWQTKVVGAYRSEQVTVDWERQQVQCPQGKWSLPWRSRAPWSRSVVSGPVSPPGLYRVSHARVVYPLPARFLKLLPRAQAEHEPPEQLHVRIGIHLGDIVQKAGDVFGDGVSIAARLQALAAPDPSVSRTSSTRKSSGNPSWGRSSP